MADYIGQILYIQPTRIVSLPEYSGSGSRYSIARIKNEKNLKSNKHDGRVSYKAAQKMRNMVNWLLCAAEPKKVYQKSTKRWFDFKVNFVTLTLPDTIKKIDNRTLQNKLLNPFLTYLRKYHGLSNYVWKLEFQKNGKLHVHFISDCFIHHKTLRKQWNKLLGSNGFLVDFYNKFGHSDPNSTDIHSVRKIRNLAAYLAKYLSKNSNDLKNIKGRIWGASQSLSKALKTRCSLFSNELRENMSCLMHKSIEFKKLERIDTLSGKMRDFGEVFYLTYIHWRDIIKGSIREAFDSTLLEIKGALRSTKSEFILD